jgi:hypothetical protein
MGRYFLLVKLDELLLFNVFQRSHLHNFHATSMQMVA